jgi:putative transposase
MKRKRHTASQIVSKLREVEAAQAKGRSLAEVAKEIGVSEHTIWRWRNQYGSAVREDVKRFRELERENSRLKKVVAEQVMDIESLKELLRKKW